MVEWSRKGADNQQGMSLRPDLFTCEKPLAVKVKSISSWIRGSNRGEEAAGNSSQSQSPAEEPAT